MCNSVIVHQHRMSVNEEKRKKWGRGLSRSFAGGARIFGAFVKVGRGNGSMEEKTRLGAEVCEGEQR